MDFFPYHCYSSFLLDAFLLLLYHLVMLAGLCFFLKSLLIEAVPFLCIFSMVFLNSLHVIYKDFVLSNTNILNPILCPFRDQGKSHLLSCMFCFCF